MPKREAKSDRPRVGVLGVVRFWRSAAWRALVDTGRFLWIQGLVLGGLVVIVSLMASWLLEHRKLHMRVALLSAGIGFGSVMLSGLVIALVRAPAVMAKERAEEVERLEGELRQFRGPKWVRLLSDPVATRPSHSFKSRGVMGGPEREVEMPERWRFHVFPRNNGVGLECQRWHAEVPADIECWVEDPKGERHQGRLHRSPDSTVRCVYPIDFDVEPEAGTHHVHWMRTRDPKDRFRRARFSPMNQLHVPIDFVIGVEPA